MSFLLRLKYLLRDPRDLDGNTKLREQILASAAPEACEPGGDPPSVGTASATEAPGSIPLNCEGCASRPSTKPISTGSGYVVNEKPSNIPKESISLLPCPFCGAAVHFEDAEAKGFTVGVCWSVICPTENCIMYDALPNLYPTKRAVAEAWNRRMPVRASSEGASEADQTTANDADLGSRQEPSPVAADIEQLMKFYSVSRLEDLAVIQARHVERLQARLPPTPDTQPRKSRFA